MVNRHILYVYVSVLQVNAPTWFQNRIRWDITFHPLLSFASYRSEAYNVRSSGRARADTAAVFCNLYWLPDGKGV